MNPRLTLLGSAALGLAVLAGCGSSSSGSSGSVSGTTLTIYSSLPLQGSNRPNSVATNNGAQLALDTLPNHKIGKYTIVFKQLDDSTAQAGKWDPGQTTQNAHTAVNDGSTIGYIGEFNSGASAISIPLLNRADIPQISPSNTAVGLTTNAPGSTPGEPGKYYPTGKRTYARVVPKDTVQAAAQAALQKSEGCTKTYVLDDQEVYGQGLANNFKLSSPSAGITVVGMQGYDPKAANYRSLGDTVAASGANCVFISAIVDNNAVQLTKDVANAAPKTKIFGPDGVEIDTYFDPTKGGIPVALDPRVFMTVATLPPTQYPPAGQAFFREYEKKYGTPQAYAVYGYEAMSLMLDSIKRATNNGTSAATRSGVVSALFATKDRPSVLGTYSIDKNGDTTLLSYGAYSIINGKDHFLKSIKATVA